MMKYKFLILDADETLYDFKKSERYALEHSMKELCMDYNENIHLPLYSKINAAIWKEFELGQITQDKLKTERFRRFAHELNRKPDESLPASYERHLGDASFIYDGSKELLESLCPHYRLIMITNGLKKVQESRFRKSILSPYFEDIIISEDVQLSKPDKRIFEYALEKMDCKDKSNALIIGDSLTSDICGGNNAGIDTCWYNPHKIINHTDIKPTCEAENYTKILELLM